MQSTNDKYLPALVTIISVPSSLNSSQRHFISKLAFVDQSFGCTWRSLSISWLSFLIPGVDVDNDVKGGDELEFEDETEVNWLSSILMAALDSFCHNEDIARFELLSVSFSWLDLMTIEDKDWSDSLSDELVVRSCTVHKKPNTYISVFTLLSIVVIFVWRNLWPDSCVFCGLRKDVELAVYHVILTDKGLNLVKGHNEGAIETNNILVFVWPHTSLIATLILLILNDLNVPLVIVYHTVL